MEQQETTIERIMVQRAASKKRPIYGCLELLPLCNMNCDMCYIHMSNSEMKKQGRLRTIDEWLMVAKEMEKAGVLFVLLTGGEPLLYPEFKTLYLELQKLGMIVTINTNGTLIDEQWAEFFKNNRPRRINITLYGSSEKTYVSLCHYPNGYEKALRGIQLLKDKGVDVKINGSVTKVNVKDTDDIYAIGHKLDIPVHMDTYMLPNQKEVMKSFDDQTRLNPKQAAKMRLKTFQTEMQPQAYRQYLDQTIQQLENSEIQYDDRITCQAAHSSFTIDWQGRMRPCVSLFEPAANVFETGFENGWQKIVKEAENLRLNPKCTKCHLRPVCDICVASSFWETGSYDEVPQYLCEFAQEFERLLYIEKNQ